MCYIINVCGQIAAGKRAEKSVKKKAVTIEAKRNRLYKEFSDKEAWANYFCRAIEEAYRLGCLFDSWTESFHNELWMQSEYPRDASLSGRNASHQDVR